MEAWACNSCGGENPAGTRFCGHCGAPAASGQGAAPGSAPEHGVASAPAHDASDALRSFVSTHVAARLEETGGTFGEERRLVTAVFADISGFTSLAEVLDPEQLTEVIDPVVSALTDVAATHEGYVEKFAGDALLALFGAPVSHDDDAHRALRTATEMHLELERMLPRLPPGAQDLTLHVGVNSGHGIARIIGSRARMDYAVLGDAVILAQRLESAAPAGATFVGETTFRLARDGFEFEQVGELTLKGKKRPVPAWRLLREMAGGRRAARGKKSTELIGRAGEIAAADSMLSALAKGKGGILTVTGEPGLGKSHLTRTVAQRATKTGARWIEGRCLSYGAGLPYWPFAQIVRDFAGLDRDDETEVAARRLGDALERLGTPAAEPFFARLLNLPPPPGDTTVTDLELEAFRRGLHEAFTGFLAHLSAGSGLVLAVEDIHWADMSSIRLAADIVRHSAGMPLLVYVTARPEGAAVAAEIAGAGPAERHRALALEPLDSTAVKLLLVSILQGEPPGRLASLVAGRAAGNPYFVEEIVLSLQDESALTRGSSGAWELARGWHAGSVPPTLEGVLSTRIDLLPASARAALSTASVLGRRVRLPIVTAVGGNGDLQGSLDLLTERGFLDTNPEDPEELVFHHALLQEVAYERLLRRQRRNLHRAVAAAAEEIYSGDDDFIELLARHTYLGQMGRKAFDYLVQAGRRAAQLFANDEAIVHFEHAAEVARDDPIISQQELSEVLLVLADLRELTGDYVGALDLYGEIQDAGSYVRARRGLASTLRRQGSYDKALEVIAAAFAAAQPGDDVTPLHLERAWTLAVEGLPVQALEAAGAGLAVSGLDHELAGYFLVQMARVEETEGYLETAIGHAREAQRVFQERGDARGQVTALRTLGSSYTESGDLRGAQGALTDGLTLARRIGTVEEAGGCLINLGLVRHRMGALDEAIACDRQAIAEFERVGHGSGRAIGYSNLSEKLMDKGDLAGAFEHSSKALQVAREIGHGPTEADALETMASIFLKRGDFVTAAGRAEEAADVNLRMGAHRYAARALVLAAEAWGLSGNEARAAAAATRAAELAR